MEIKMKKIESLFSEGEDLYDLLEDDGLIEDYRRFMKKERENEVTMSIVLEWLLIIFYSHSFHLTHLFIFNYEHLFSIVYLSLTSHLTEQPQYII